LRLSLGAGVGLALAVAPSAFAGPLDATQEQCFVIATVDGKPVIAPFPQLDLIHGDQTAPLPALPTGGVIKAINCRRDSLVPAPGDYRVARQYRLGLSINNGDSVGSLQRVDGRYQYSFLRGRPRRGEAAAVASRLEDYWLKHR
jgi:hypothetical protein